MNLTVRCATCKYPHHFESEDLSGETFAFLCAGCGSPQEVKLPFKESLESSDED